MHYQTDSPDESIDEAVSTFLIMRIIMYSRNHLVDYKDTILKIKKLLESNSFEKLKSMLFKIETATEHTSAQRYAYIQKYSVMSGSKLKQNLADAEMTFAGNPFWISLYKETIDTLGVSTDFRTIFNITIFMIFLFCLYNAYSPVSSAFLKDTGFNPSGLITGATIISSMLVLLTLLIMPIRKVSETVTRALNRKSNAATQTVSNNLIDRFKSVCELRLEDIPEANTTKELVENHNIALYLAHRPPTHASTLSSNNYSDDKVLSIRTLPKAKRRPQGSPADLYNDTKLTLTSLILICWSITELGIDIKVKWDESTDKVYDDNRQLSPIHKVRTQSASFFVFLPQKTLTNQALKNNDQKFIENCSNVQNDPSPKDTIFRKLNDQINRSATLSWKGKEAKIFIKRETVLQKVESRAYGYDIISRTDNHTLFFAPIYGKGLHTNCDKNKTSYGKVNLDPTDINALQNFTHFNKI